MDNNLFVIAIGGTGMRCLESLVHLCAMGMFDNKTIDILTLDTDQNNGNKGRVESLIELYNKIKSDDDNNPDGGKPQGNTFFSAKLNLYKFYTTYGDANQKTYRTLAGINSGQNKEENEDLAKLFFAEKTVQDFDLAHGYRAQTHLGSLLMYHGIIEAARKVRQGNVSKGGAEDALKQFLDKLCANSASRVFVFGSIFGGTGASSIPVIPVALRDAVNIYSENLSLDFDKIKFGSTLLTDYFTFSSPDNNSKAEEKIIADSNNFALNCQAAMQFYEADPTVKHTYKRFYHIGWPLKHRTFDNNENGGKPVTGGGGQKNPCHVVELLCASAAYDFFNLADTDLANTEAKYLFRTVEVKDDGNMALRGSDFVKDGDLFEGKFGALLSLAHIVLARYEAAWNDEGKAGINQIKDTFAKKNIPYDNVSQKQCDEINQYFRDYFGYKFLGDQISKGWAYQVNDTVPGTMIFKNEAFPELRKYMDNKSFNFSCGGLFTDESKNWGSVKKPLLGSPTDTGFQIFVKNIDKATEPNSGTVKEKFIAHIYNAIAKH